MDYEKTVTARFLRRPNRFIAEVELNGRPEMVHVKNTGRCKELLVPNALVVLAEGKNPARKTKYDLIAVYKEREGKAPLLINMDSQLPNTIAERWIRRSGIFSGEAKIRREFTYGKSRFDFYIEDGDRRAFMEVKGVTLERNGEASFPDAPTERGVKHINELAAAVAAGYETYILFVIQMKEISVIRPNDETHPAFGDALRRAESAGVKILAVDCVVTENAMEADAFVPVDIKK